jgi:hypothetical protein
MWIMCFFSVLSFLYFNYLLNSSHNIEIINLGSKKINHINIIFYNIIIYVVRNCSSVISMEVYISYWY